MKEKKVFALYLKNPTSPHEAPHLLGMYGSMEFARKRRDAKIAECKTQIMALHLERNSFIKEEVVQYE